MEQKPYIKATIEKHIADEIAERAEAYGTTKSEYLALVAKWWFGKGSPPVDEAEARLMNQKQHGEVVKAKRAS